MKTKEEIAKYLESHKVELFDLITIQGYLHVKGIDVNSIVGDGKILTAKTFIEWFERETKEDNYNIMTYEVSDSFKREYFPKEKQPKEENQDIITFEGKEYEFIEYTWGECCRNCALREHGSCTLSPLICCSEYRRDMREGYFKLIKPKNLGLIPNEFYYTEEDNYSWVIQFKEFIDDDNHPISYYYMLKIHDNDINSNFSCANNSWIKATPAQKQQLIDKVQEETGKVWKEDTKMFEAKALVFNNNKL